MEKKFGALVNGDVFIYNGKAWQKIERHTSVNFENNKVIRLTLAETVDYVGDGIWPDEERLKGVMVSE